MIKKRTKKNKTAALCVLLSIFILLALGIIWQWNNIMAVISFMNYSQIDLEEQISLENTYAEEAISKLPGNIEDLTDAQKEQLIKGEITSQEAIKLILDNTEDDLSDDESSPKESADNSNTVSNSSEANAVQSDISPSPSESNDERRIKELVAELYVLRTSYTASLDALIQQATEEYKALPESEQTKSAKKKILLKYVDQASSMETQCDAQVNAIITELKPLLKKTGGDLSLIDEIKKIYNQEKSLKKAYYMSIVNQ
jgi:hypothetical protein